MHTDPFKSGHALRRLSLIPALFLVAAATPPQNAGAAWVTDGVNVAAPQKDQFGAIVIPDGAGGCIIAWEDMRNCNVDIYAQRVDASGNELWAKGGVPVCTAPLDQGNIDMVLDGTGSAIVVWDDRRGADLDVYGQRIDSSGNATWTPNGVPIATGPGDQTRPKLVAGALGGVIVTWYGFLFGSFDIYVQKLDVAGNPVWTPGGVVLCGEPGIQFNPVIATDLLGGAFVVWTDFRSGTSYDIYARRVDASGTPQWAAGGIPVCVAMGDQVGTVITVDGAGGVIVAWEDRRNEPASGRDIYAQRIGPGGTVAWAADGVALCKAPADQTLPVIAEDKAGGAVVAWMDGRFGNTDIYAQHVGSDGVPTWTSDGVPVCALSGSEQTAPAIITGGSGSGALVTWADQRSDPQGDIYAQSLDPSGNPVWAVNGVVVCAAPGIQWTPEIAPDGSGGAFIVWSDLRGAAEDVYASRISGTGHPLWTRDGVLIAGPGSTEQRPAIVEDGAGGAIVAWQDRRNCDDDIYANRLDASGNVLWGADGIAVCTVGGLQQGPLVCTDGAGGAIITWTDARSLTSHIYAQRVSSSGVPLWAAGGVPVCTAKGVQTAVRIAADDSGGAYIAWQDSRNADLDIYIQRIGSSGTPDPGWAIDGNPVCVAAGAQSAPAIVTDGSRGVWVAWQDRRSGNADIYAQDMNSLGVGICTTDGFALCAEVGDQTSPEIVSDGARGAIVTWEDRRAGNIDIYACAIKVPCSPAWAANGVPLCAEASTQFEPAIASDLAGGAIVAWRDSRSGNDDIYSQRVDRNGVVLWTVDGIAVCDGPGSQSSPVIVSDRSGGACIAWRDRRNGNDDIFATRLDGTGALLCGDCGVALCTAVGDQLDPAIVTDAMGGAIVAWGDFRPGWIGDEDIYAMRLAPQCGSYAAGVDGGTAAPRVQLSQNRPNPFNPSTVIEFFLARRGPTRLRVYDVQGKLVATLLDKMLPPGRYEVGWMGTDDQGRPVGSGIYFYDLEAAGRSMSRRMVLIR